MEKDKFSYEFEVIKAIRFYEERFNQQGLSIDSSYLDYFGNQCPKCENVFKVYRNTVKGIASISAFMILEQNKAVLYPLCKSCVKKINLAFNTSENSKVEEFIFSKLPDLKRHEINEKEKLEEIKKEHEIVKKIQNSD